MSISFAISKLCRLIFSLMTIVGRNTIQIDLKFDPMLIETTSAAKHTRYHINEVQQTHTTRVNTLTLPPRHPFHARLDDASSNLDISIDPLHLAKYTKSTTPNESILKLVITLSPPGKRKQIETIAPDHEYSYM